MADHGIWMPLYWGDYFGKTSALTCEEHGAYLLLIGAYWQRGRALPDDDQYLSTATRNSGKKWKIIRPKVAEYFAILDGEWRHERVEKELLKSCDRISASKAAAHARWMPSTITTTKERKTRARARPNGNGADAPALSPEQLAEMLDKTDRILKRGKYEEKFS